MKTTIGICVVSAQEYGYDRLAWVENERGERYTFERDPNGEVIAERGFDGRERRYGRDGDGTVLVTHLPDGTAIHHQHDLAGRLTYSRYPDGSWERHGNTTVQGGSARPATHMAKRCSSATRWVASCARYGTAIPLSTATTAVHG